MDEEHDERIEELFHRLVDLPEHERKAHLDRECGSDDALRAELEGLLAHGTARDGFLERPALRIGPELPQRIGRFRIVRKLADGGMGSVYEAEQENPRRLVALKVLQDERLQPQGLKRFEREAELLAKLRHPGIAQVLEAGTFRAAEGEPLRPYYAMELIHGLPIDAYADARGLSVGERLELMARLCDAVEHAHAAGVIHRDLKPANVLVDEQGQPKILDFGIARAPSGGATRQTEAGEVLGTLTYMSPEQAAGRPEELDKRSDVYALGVMLYQLLARRLPYDLGGQSLVEAGRTIQEHDPPRLGLFGPELRGDVETIVAKALAKEKQRRYDDAAALAADLRRHLSHEPIAARPTSAVYQLRKFARRNRGLVGGVVAALVTLLVTLVVVSLQALRLERALGRQAEVNAFLRGVFLSGGPYAEVSADPLPTFAVDARLMDVYDAWLARLERNPGLLSHPQDLASILQVMAYNYYGVARYEEGARCARRALALVEGLGRSAEALRIECKRTLAWNLAGLGDPEAPQIAREATLECERHYGVGHLETLQSMRCQWFSNLRLGYHEDCIHLSKRMQAIVGTAGLEREPGAIFVDFLRARSLALMEGRPSEAEPLARDALARLRALGADDGMEASLAHHALAEILEIGGALDEAEEHCRRSIAIRDVAGGGASTLDMRYLLARVEHRRSGGEVGDAPFRAVLDEARAELGPHAPATTRMIAGAATFLWLAGDHEAACRLFDECWEILAAGRAALPAHAHIASQHARSLLERGARSEAEERFRRGLEIASGFDRGVWRQGLYDDRLLLSGLARLLTEDGRHAEAERQLALLTERLSEPVRPSHVRWLAADLLACGRAVEAESITRRAVEQVRELTDRDAARFLAVFELHADALEHAGRATEAAQTRREAEDLRARAARPPSSLDGE
jgi:hypothetical protein